MKYEIIVERVQTANLEIEATSEAEAKEIALRTISASDFNTCDDTAFINEF